MSDLHPSPFPEPKGRRWVWIVPSVLLHLVILVIWLLLPEPEPRQPGARKLTINEAQAEELQERVEEANLKALRAKVSELQSIKAAMARIREEEMARVREFEQSMVDEAPQNIAVLLGELAAVYRSIHDTYEGIEAAVDTYAEHMPVVRKAAEAGTVAGIRALPKLQAFYGSFEGVSDRFEVAFYETGAILKAIEVKLEWVKDNSLSARIEALKTVMETTFSMHREASRSVPYSWKREASFRELTENMEDSIRAVEAFRQSEIEGQAEIASKREVLEGSIAAAEAELAQANEALGLAEAAFEAIDRKADREAWAAQRNTVRELQRSKSSLDNELRNMNKELSRTTYKQDGRLAQSVNRIENRLEHALPPLPDRRLAAQAMAQLQEITRQIEALAEALEVPL